MEEKIMETNKIDQMIKLLKREYPDARCLLDYYSPLQLLIAGRLSSQCTDKKVNMVTKTLFKRYKTLDDFATADINELKEIIKPCGLFNIKSKNIIEMSRMIIDVFDRKIPDNMDDLIKLPGIGRKTANLILGEVYKKPAVICDTHCIRITNLLGLSFSRNAEKVEQQLREVLPPKESCLFCHLMVYHGRKVCKSRRPDCKKCVIKDYCKYWEAIKDLMI